MVKAPEWRREYRFAAAHVGHGPGIKRRLQAAELKDWRFDFAWPDLGLAVEVDGGGWSGGRHTRGRGHHEDIVKATAAAIQGWEIVRCNAATIADGTALKAIEVKLHGKKQRP